MTGSRASAPTAIGFPPQFRAALIALARLDRVEADRLVAALTEIGSFRPVADLEAALRTTLGRDESDVSGELVAALLSLSGMARLTDPTSIASAASQSPTLELNEDERARLAANLKPLLESPEIFSTATAVDLLTQHERNYQSARVITDIRPVFARDIHDAPSGAVIIENLQLQTWDRNGETEMIHIAMDDADLEELREAIDRALAKSNTLRTFLDAQAVSVFNLDKR